MTVEQHDHVGVWETIRRWFDPRCRVPGCPRHSPRFSSVCEYHAGPKDEGYPGA